MKAPSKERRVERDGARLMWVPLAQMKASPMSQRDLNQARVDHLATNMDLDEIGNPTVNKVNASLYHILDGQHRVEALRAIGYGDQQVQCWVYEGLTDAEEAEKFLTLNDYLTVSAFQKFTKGVNAGRETEVDIDRIVRASGLVVSKDKVPGAVGAVGTLRRVYGRGGPKTLGRALRIIRDAYGDPGLEAPVIDGIGMLCQRYNGQLDDATAVERLSKASGGVNGLLGKAEILRRSTGNQKNHCVAAAAVEIINGKRGGTKLPSWWKTDS